MDLSAYEVALRYERAEPYNVIKLGLPNGGVISLAQGNGFSPIHGDRKKGTVEAWNGEEVTGFLNAVELANYILENFSCEENK
mgnify:CR=1 FL=1|tara:strand:- start:389 stop:637 length:249 start_codon:yes stop_codon:yes gene_type:complete